MDDQNAVAVKDARELQLFEIEHGSCSALYCLICSTVIFPLFTYGTSAESEFWLQDEGDCEALTLVIFPSLKVTVADKTP